MKKGKYGITYTAYAVIAFVLALFGHMLLAGLLLAFVLVKEKDEWLSRQCMQAFFLTFVQGVVAIIAMGFVMVSALVARVLGHYSGNFGVVVVFVILFGLVNLFLFVFQIIGLVNVSKGREANVPIVSGFAYRAQGSRQQTYPAQGYYQPPMGQQYPAPQYPAQPYPAQTHYQSAPMPSAPHPVYTGPVSPPPQYGQDAPGAQYPAPSYPAPPNYPQNQQDAPLSYAAQSDPNAVSQTSTEAEYAATAYDNQPSASHESPPEPQMDAPNETLAVDENGSQNEAGNPMNR